MWEQRHNMVPWANSRFARASFFMEQSTYAGRLDPEEFRMVWLQILERRIGLCFQTKIKCFSIIPENEARVCRIFLGLAISSANLETANGSPARPPEAVQTKAISWAQAQPVWPACCTGKTWVMDGNGIWQCIFSCAAITIMNAVSPSPSSSPPSPVSSPSSHSSSCPRHRHCYHRRHQKSYWPLITCHYHLSKPRPCLLLTEYGQDFPSFFVGIIHRQKGRNVTPH